MLKKLLLTILTICCFIPFCKASDTNSIRKLTFKPELSDLKNDDFEIEYITTDFDNFWWGRSIYFLYYSNFSYNYIFYNEKGKKVAKYNSKNSKSFDISKLPDNTKSYKVVPVYNWGFDLNKIVQKSVKTQMEALDMNWKIGTDFYGNLSKFDDIVKYRLNNPFNAEKDETKYYIESYDGSSLKFEKYRDDCINYSEDKSGSNFYACGAVIIDVNGKNIPNKSFSSSELNDKFLALVYADKLVYFTNGGSNFIYKNISPDTISPELLKDYYINSRNFFKKVKIEETLPIMRLNTYNKTGIVDASNIELRFYDDKNNILNKNIEEINIGRLDFGLKEFEDCLYLDFNSIPENAVSFSLNIVKK